MNQALSRVFVPASWIALLAGVTFLAAGLVVMLAVAPQAPPGLETSLVRIGGAVFVIFGAIPTAWIIRNTLWPAYVHCAVADALPGVPREPLVYEGAITFGHLTHELCEDAAGWSLRPSRRQTRAQKVFLISFGVPFLVGFAVLLTWVFHRQFGLGGWVLSAILATLITCVCGGIPMLLIATLLRTANRHLTALTITRDETDLELDSPEQLDVQPHNISDAASWFLGSDSTRHALKIPRQSVLAVQLCPWMLRTFGERYAAVQGLLVVASASQADVQRLPLLLSGDLNGAARLMEKLAAVLAVPYLFHGDAAGWKAERLRAKKRAALRTAAFMS